MYSFFMRAFLPAITVGKKFVCYSIAALISPLMVAKKGEDVEGGFTGALAELDYLV